MRRSSPVQQWLDSMPPDEDSETLKVEDCKGTDSSHEITEIELSTESHNTVVEATPVNDIQNESNSNVTPKKIKKLQKQNSVQSEPMPIKPRNPLLRDCSLQSDGSNSSGCSVLNVLGARKVDAESVLLALGFGPSEKQQKLQRIPDRFLIPSKLQGISTEQFIKDEQHTMKMHDCGVFGYRGLTGNPHAQPSTIVAKIIDCIVKDDELREKAITKARLSVTDIRNGSGYDPGLKNA